VAQISLYVDDKTAERLSVAAKAQNSSVSKFVAAIISERLSLEETENERKLSILRGLRGSIDDPTFSDAPDIPCVAEESRRYDLI